MKALVIIMAIMLMEPAMALASHAHEFSWMARHVDHGNDVLRGRGVATRVRKAFQVVHNVLNEMARAGNLPDKALMRVDVTWRGRVFTRYLSAHVDKGPWRVHPRRGRRITGRRGIPARRSPRMRKTSARFGRKTKP